MIPISRELGVNPGTVLFMAKEVWSKEVSHLKPENLNPKHMNADQASQLEIAKDFISKSLAL